MECSEFQAQAQAYVDGEFDEREATELRLHQERCPECAQLARHHARMRHHFKAAWTPDKAPEELKARLMARLAQEVVVAEAPSSVSVQAPPPSPERQVDSPRQDAPWGGRRPGWVIGPVAAALAAAAVGVIFWDNPMAREEGPPLVAPPEVVAQHNANSPRGLAPGLVQPVAMQAVSPGVRPQVVQGVDVDPIIKESVNWHTRNLPIEVTGPSDLRVRTWLKPKVDFPVRLPRFDRTGRVDVSLLGARLSNIREKQAAYVVYEVDGNKISVMLFNGEPRPQQHPARGNREIYTANGYNVAVVEDNGVTYSITSELPREDMAQLVDAAFSQ